MPQVAINPNGYVAEIYADGGHPWGPVPQTWEVLQVTEEVAAQIRALPCVPGTGAPPDPRTAGLIEQA